MNKKTGKIILGIDPGIADTGFGVIEITRDNRMKEVAHGSIKTPAGQDTANRLEEIAASLKKLIDEHRPELVAVEELFFCQNVKTALIVGQARGVVVLVASQNRIPVVEFTPLQVKQAVSAYGRAGKMQVQRMVKMLLSLNDIPKPDDAADALAVAICAANSGIPSD